MILKKTTNNSLRAEINNSDFALRNYKAELLPSKLSETIFN